MGLTVTEARRKLVHIAVGGFALLLRFMTWRQAALMAVAAVFFNWQALPRLGGRNPEGRHRRRSRYRRTAASLNRRQRRERRFPPSSSAWS